MKNLTLKQLFLFLAISITVGIAPLFGYGASDLQSLTVTFKTILKPGEYKIFKKFIARGDDTYPPFKYSDENDTAQGFYISKTTGEYDEAHGKWFGIFDRKAYPDNFLNIMIAVFGVFVFIILVAYLWTWNLKKLVNKKTEEFTRELDLKTKMQDQLEKAVELLDLARKKALEASYEAEEANEAKTRFLANISHELRTPLHGIMGISKVLESSDLTSEQTDMVKMINTSAYNLIGILSDLLDFSSINSGKLVLRKSSFRLKSLIDTASPVMQVIIQEKDIELIIDADNHDPLINTDKERVGQILLNLFSNAVKYTDRGQIKVSIKHYNEKLEISVADTGIGIIPEDMDLIFEPFSRIYDNRKNLVKGVGLGLSIVKSLVELLEGEINVESNKGKGSRFIVFIPAPLVKEEVPNSEDLIISADLFSNICSEVNMLIVEDENINRIYLKKILEKRGCKTETAVNGLEALDMIKEKRYNIVLMDLTMPLMDGITATYKIREYEKNTGAYPVPIIALTAHAYPEDKERCVDAGMDGYLAKPFQPADLMKEIERVVNLRKSKNPV